MNSEISCILISFYLVEPPCSLILNQDLLKKLNYLLQLPLQLMLLLNLIDIYLLGLVDLLSPHFTHSKKCGFINMNMMNMDLPSFIENIID